MSSVHDPPCLVHRDAFGRETAYALEQAVVLGRSPEAAVRMDDAAVSWFHCTVYPLPDDRAGAARTTRWYVADLGSRNGTWLHGQRITRPARLRHRDVIQVGRTHFLVVLLKDDADTPQPAGASG